MMVDNFSFLLALGSKMLSLPIFVCWIVAHTDKKKKKLYFLIKIIYIHL